MIADPQALVRTLLKKTGLSQVKLAQAIGISERTVRRILNTGQASPLAIESIQRYAGTLKQERAR